MSERREAPDKRGLDSQPEPLLGSSADNYLCPPTPAVPGRDSIFLSLFFSPYQTPLVGRETEVVMADEETNRPQARHAATLTLPLRPRVSDQDKMASAAHTAIPAGLVSPGIQVEFHGDPSPRPAPIYPQYVFAPLI